MIEYNKINAKLSNLQVSKLKIAVKNNEGTTLRISAKTLNSQDLRHELFLTTRKTTCQLVIMSKAQITNLEVL